MPATISQPPIPVPTKDNLLACVMAIRNALIAAANVDAGRSDASGTVPAQGPNQAMPSPSQFTVTSQVVVPVTYSVPIAGGTGTASVVVPQIQSIIWTNNVSGETIVWTAPGKLFTGGTIGAAL